MFIRLSYIFREIIKKIKINLHRLNSKRKWFNVKFERLNSEFVYNFTKHAPFDTQPPLTTSPSTKALSLHNVFLSQNPTAHHNRPPPANPY